MKKTSLVLFFIVVVTIFFVTGCASTQNEDPVMKVEVATEDEIDRVVAVDWTDRTLGEVSAPTWLKNMRRGNSDTFKEMWGIDSDRVVK